MYVFFSNRVCFFVNRVWFSNAFWGGTHVWTPVSSPTPPHIVTWQIIVHTSSTCHQQTRHNRGREPQDSQTSCMKQDQHAERMTNRVAHVSSAYHQLRNQHSMGTNHQNLQQLQTTNTNVQSATSNGITRICYSCVGWFDCVCLVCSLFRCCECL